MKFIIDDISNKACMLAACFLVIVFISSNINAAVINAASSGLLSPSNTITFDEFAFNDWDLVTNEYESYGVIFSPALSAITNISTGDLSGNILINSTQSTCCLASFSIYFDSTISDASFIAGTNAGGISFFTALLDGVEVESFSGNTDLISGSGYFGFTNIAFNEIRFTPDVNGNYAMLIDNIQFNVSSVPIPSAVWLFGSGLLGLVGLARRKANA